MGEDLNVLGCSEFYKRAIERFRPYECSDLNEWEIKKRIQVGARQIRVMRREYHRFNNLPIPETVPGPWSKFKRVSYIYKPKYPLILTEFEIGGIKNDSG